MNPETRGQAAHTIRAAFGEHEPRDGNEAAYDAVDALAKAGWTLVPPGTVTIPGDRRATPITEDTLREAMRRAEDGR